MNEAELLFTDILNCDRLSLYLNRGSVLDKDKSTFVSSVFKRRTRGEPIQYILGKTEFMGFEFRVGPDVLIPRPETEILVETVTQTVARRTPHAARLKILDIGTGSGCIAISLAKFLPDAEITATDVSGKAIEVAQYNAKLNNVAEKITFIKSDLFANCELRTTNHDIIVCNPPYIAASEIDNLVPQIKYEPRLALDGGNDGLYFYRRIIDGAPYYLQGGGFLMLEIGFNQKDGIRNIFQKSKNFEIIEVVKDYNDIERVIVARNIKWIN